VPDPSRDFAGLVIAVMMAEPQHAPLIDELQFNPDLKVYLVP
jgi:hypothetical protein